MYANEVQIERRGSGFIKNVSQVRAAHERDFLIGWLSAQTRSLETRRAGFFPSFARIIARNDPFMMRLC